MADSASIGANFSDYQGSPNLGEVGLGVFNIDTRPLQQLAQYTFFYNRSEYEQRQKDVEAMANEISDYTSIDLTSGIEKDAKLLQSKWDKLNDFVRDHPESLNYKDRKAWAEYKKLRGDLANDIKGAGIRNIINMVRDKEIKEATTVAEKERLQKDKDDEIERTDIRTPLKYTNKFDIEPVKYAAPKKLSFTVTKEYPNYITGTDVLTTDMADVSGQANAAITGLSKFMNPQTDLEKQQYASQKNTGKLEPILSAQNLSAVIPQFVKDGKFDYDAAKKSGNTILAGNASNVQAYNRKMEDMTNAIKSGVFKDKLSGGVAAFGVSGINENDYQKIDLDKGYITPFEYAKLNIMGLAEPTVTSKTEIKPTGEANDLLKARLTQSGENYRSRLAHAEKTSKAAEVIDKPAILFGQHIDRLKNFFKNDNNKRLLVPYSQVDDKTRVAAKLSEGDYIIYKPDGSYIVSTDNQGKTVKSVGTIDNLAQGYIDAVRTIDLAADSKDASMAEGFLIKSENKFKEIFGTTSGKYIWDNWGESKVPGDTKANQKVDEYGVPIQ